ncbi:cupin domain-containing protein [Flavobacteriaceae bacterium AH-315-B10]|nr:cupin domain-containing protein [Flavobacteriaceae bacterium AH-315-B10]
MTNNIFKTTFLSILLASLLFTCKTDSNLPNPLQAGWNNEAVCELLEENDNIRVLRCTFKPGVGHEKHYHNRHFGYAIAGSKFRIKDTTGTREVSFPTNGYFYSEGTTWHEALNIGDSTAIFLIIEPK